MNCEAYVPLNISNQVLIKLQENIDNTICIDCSSGKPEYASVDHGTFICSLCAESQKRLRSFTIKPISSEWTIKTLRLMTSGGNSAFQAFFIHYNLLDAPIDYKYRTRAAQFYRETLSVLAEGGEPIFECPSLEEGLETLDKLNFEETSINSTNESMETTSRWKWLGSLYTKYPKIQRKSLEAVESGLKKIRELTHIDDFVKKTKIIGENTVASAKYEALKVIKDFEEYMGRGERYFNLFTACSKSEQSGETEFIQ